MSDQQYSSIGSDNGLAPTMLQVIIWTNDGKFTDACMRPGLDELKRNMCIKWKANPWSITEWKGLSGRTIKDKWALGAIISLEVWSYRYDGDPYTWKESLHIEMSLGLYALDWLVQLLYRFIWDVLPEKSE